MDVSKPSFLKRGKAVLATAEAELAKKKATPPPKPPVYRFRIPDRSESSVIILDASFDEAVGLYEHNIQGKDGRWGNIMGCTRRNCSICREHGESYYVIFLTILDLRSYVKRTGETVPSTKMLLPIKLDDLPQFQAIFLAAMKEAETLRGAYLTVKRESLFQPMIWRFVEVLDEKTLVKYYGKQNITPFDYLDIFTKWAK